MYTVSELMTTEVHTLTPDDSLATARQLMVEHRIRHIPIVDSDKKLLGLLTHRDLLAASDANADRKEYQTRDAWEQSVPVAREMTVKVDTIDENMSMRGAALEMQKYKIGCLPVVDDNRLIGIVTDSDFVGLAINLLEQLEEVEPIDDEL